MKYLYIMLLFSLFACGKAGPTSLLNSESDRPVTPNFLPVVDKGIVAPYNVKDGGDIYVRSGKALTKLLDSSSSKLSPEQLDSAQRALSRFNKLKKYVVDSKEVFVGLADFKDKNDKRLGDAHFLNFEMISLDFQLKQFPAGDRDLIRLQVDIQMWKDDRGLFADQNASTLGESVEQYRNQEVAIINWLSEKLVPWMLAN